MISVNALRGRKSGFRVNSWILDSGAFTELSTYGRYRHEVDEYAQQIEQWRECGTLLAAVCQDYMCEQFILKKTGLSVREHQEATIDRYVRLAPLTKAYVMPVLQGFTPAEYVDHIRQYGNILSHGRWVGVGSVCKRNSNPDAIEDLLLAIKQERPDLRLHAFGIKLTALQRPTIRELLWSSDSMAWSHAARKESTRVKTKNVAGADQNDPRLALAYAAEVELLLGEKQFVQPQLFNWWI